MKSSFHLLLISSEQDITGEGKIICNLFEQGLGIFHLRKYDWGIEQTRRFLEILPTDFHNRIVLHSHFELLNTFKVKGIHLNEDNRKLRKQFEKYHIVSTSFHSLNDLKENSFPYEYVFLSPIFDSISKAGHQSKFDLKLLSEELKLLKEKSSFPKIIALGGINKENIALVKQAGFSGVALLGAVWQNENTVRAFTEIQSLNR